MTPGRDTVSELTPVVARGVTVPTRPRLVIALVVGLLAGLLAALKAAQVPGIPRDFTLVWYAAWAVLQGRDPYPLIGPGRELEWVAGLFYPLPGVLLGVPFAPFSAPVACGLFMFLGAATFAWVLMRHGYGPLLCLGSAGFLNTVEVAQWSPLFAAGTVLAPLSVAWIIKPQIAAALWLVRPSWWPIIGGAGLAAIAFLIQPTWLADWRTGLADAHLSAGKGYPYLAPVMLPGGFLALACLTRWRRSEARLVAFLACAPQAMLPYDTMPLFLVPRTWKESAVLSGASTLQLMFMTVYPIVAGPFDSHADWLVMNGRASAILLYLPATVMVLRRANEGTLPAWLERRTIRWPAWVRGQPA
jgi:hypothetical protein